MGRCQIDPVVLDKKPPADEYVNVFKYVLSCFDVLLRYTNLQRMKSKLNS